MAKVKKKLRLFLVKENFTDPYTGQVYLAGEEVEEKSLLDSGWSQKDIDRAVGSLLTPHLWPTKKQQEEVIDDG